MGLSISNGAPVARPSLDDRGNCCDEAVTRASGSESQIEQAQVVVVDIELGPAIRVRWVDAPAEKSQLPASLRLLSNAKVIIEVSEQHGMLSHSIA